MGRTLGVSLGVRFAPQSTPCGCSWTLESLSHSTVSSLGASHADSFMPNFHHADQDAS